MKRPILTLIILVSALTTLAQATQPCVVKQYNQKQQKTPLAGVQVEVRDAQSATSAANGTLSLQFATLKPGDRVTVRRITKPGYEIFNKAVIDQWTITRGATTEIVLVQSSYFTQLKSKITQSSTDNYKKKYEQEKAEKERLLKAGKLKEEEYRQQLNDLEDQYDNALKNLDNYIDQFARIDLSEVSAEEQRILEMVEAGQIDEAVKAYEALDISGKLRQARENIKALGEAESRIKEEKVQQEQAIKDLKERQQREIVTLKLAGGKENYDKVAQILKENALADTTDIDAVERYAAFAYNQRDFKEAERFYLIALNGSNGNLPQQAKFQNYLGVLYTTIRDYAKAEEYCFQALENYTELFQQNPDAYHAGLAMTQHSMGLFCFSFYDLVGSIYARDARMYFFQALENYTQLFQQNPDAYRYELAMAQQSMGAWFCNFGGNTGLDDYAKAEEYLLQALENITQLFSKNPDAYRADLASIKLDLGIFYMNLYDDTKAEEYCAKAEEFMFQALEIYPQLFRHNPDAYRANLAYTHNLIGRLYIVLEDYAKAEEYYLKMLENITQLFQQDPDAYRANLASIQSGLGDLYYDLHDYAKAEEYCLQALENITQLFHQNPDAYRASLASIQSGLGDLYYDLHDYAKAEEYYLQALEHRTQLFRQNSLLYREDLAMLQMNMMLLYERMENWEKYDEMLELALNNYEILAQLTPYRYQSDVNNLLKRKQQRAAAKGQ